MHNSNFESFKITMEEWGKCLGLEEGDLEDRCEEILGTKESSVKTNAI